MLNYCCLGEEPAGICSGGKGNNRERHDGPDVGGDGGDAETSSHVPTGKRSGLYGTAAETERRTLNAEPGITCKAMF